MNKIPKKGQDKDDPESQRKRFEEQLRTEAYECMVCCEEIKARSSVWSCSNCYNIFHLKCIKQWAESSGQAESRSEAAQAPGWRCPACQHVLDRIPERYLCFCGRRHNPPMSHEPSSGPVPHSCGKKCSREKEACRHACPLNCHPGPCPPCQVSIRKSCFCGNSTMRLKCGEPMKTVHCSRPCGKKQSCDQHMCFELCHEGDCKPCGQKVDQACHCGKASRTVDCSLETKGKIFYSCTEMCSKSLSCGRHRCQDVCHEGACKPCPLGPDVLTHCPCGKARLSDLPNKFTRADCESRIPCCGQLCGKKLACGKQDEHHVCPKKCHNGPCPPCLKSTEVVCECTMNSTLIECTELLANDELRLYKCKRRCNKKFSCGRHKCTAECCTVQEHNCAQPCSKKLKCGQHTCSEPCHRNPCQPCWNVSWEDLTCSCGSERKLPPINCGTRPPVCGKICNRVHPCGHPPSHTCHSDAECPPCTVIVSKLCFGRHQELKSVHCYLKGLSCGKWCGREMSCGQHLCERVCHDGECGNCSYPCPVARSACGHACGLACHVKTSRKMCPPSKCLASINVHCACQRRSEKQPCWQINDGSNRMPASLMAKLRQQSEIDFDVASLVKKAEENRLCRLECDDLCSVYQRNRKLAEALGVKEADLSPNPGPPSYPETLKQFALTDMTFIETIHKELSLLVTDTKRSSVVSKNRNFAPMKADQRQALHELVPFFGCKSHSIDQEPNRSVVVKAPRDKCFLPVVSLMEVVKQKHGWLVLSQNGPPTRRIETNSSSNQEASRSSILAKPKSGFERKIEEPVVDYFDFNGD
ncbi:Transcriptional repressor NF-X1 [Halotydeus destructor]|nr:Transcriptional repressor NF-X1 [Halotydeus destructor]